jgi:hypothetical protein
VSAYRYQVFGLTVRSELELPELYPNQKEAVADVAIRLGEVKCAAEDIPGLHVEGGGLVLIVPDVARFRISGGSSITVHPGLGVPRRNVRLFLLGSAFGALLHQRRLLPLHANAVDIDGNAFAFMGPSGAGKSTLAAWFHDRGHRLLADDVCVVRFDGAGVPMACPGLPRLRLWLDVIERTGRGLEGLHRAYIDTSDQLEKYDVPVDPHTMVDEAVRLEAIYVLAGADAFSIERLAGVEAAEAIFANTYRGGYIAPASTQVDHWQSAMALATATPVFRLSRRMDFKHIDADGEALMRQLSARAPMVLKSS